MAFIGTVKPADSSAEVRTMYERQQSFYGYVPNYAKVFSHRPEVLARWGRLLAEIRRPMSDRIFELATFVAAIELKNTACALAHGQKLSEFMGRESVQSLAAGDIPKALSKTESVIVEFSRKIARDASTISSEDVEKLKQQGISDGEVFDIVTTVAGRAFLTKILDSLGVEMDSCANDMAEPFRNALTVGRPICAAPVEVIE